MDNTQTNTERRHSEAGMTTAEYTVGTLGACSVAAILIKLAHESIRIQSSSLILPVSSGRRALDGRR